MTRGRKRRLDIEREPNGRATRKDQTKEMEHYVTEARAKRAKISGADDMSIDVLGIARGHGYITDNQYSEGRRIERLMIKVYGPASATGSAIFKNFVTPSDDTIVEIIGQPMSDEDAKNLLERKYDEMDDYGRKTRDAVVNAVRYCRYPHNVKDFNRFLIGLTALAGDWTLKKVVDEHRKAA